MLPEKEVFSLLAGLQGRAAVYLEDIEAGEVFTVNPERVFPAASTIKVLILAALYAAAEAGIFSLDEEVAIASGNRVSGSGVLCELSPSLKLTVRDLATLMIIQSDNTATNQLIDLVGMECVNGLGRALGLKHTVLQRKMMDFAAARAGRDNLTSAGDLGRLLRLLHQGRVVSPAASAAMLATLKRQQIRDKLPALLPETAVIAHKTGDLPGLEHDAGIFYLPGKTYVLVVLTDSLTKNADGVECIARISHAVYRALRPAVQDRS